MIFFLLILLLVVVRSATVADSGKFHQDYLSKESANNIKGIFVILILFRHYVQYVNLGGVYDDPYLKLREHLDQMVVSMFWFYSGYGIMKSIQKKGKVYVEQLLKCRMFKVWINLGIAVMIFLIVDIILGKMYPYQQVILSFLGWDSIGNSNWYIFDTLVIYILVFVSFLLLKFKSLKFFEYAGCAILTILTILFVYFLMKAGKPNYWYNTVIIFPIGCWYAMLERKIENFLMRNDYLYTGCSVLIIIIYCISFQRRWQYGIEGYTIWAIAFTLTIVLFTMKVSINSSFLSWFGEHVFSIYILQRIPMMFLTKLGVAENKYTFLVLSFIITVFISMIFDNYVGKLNKKIFN